MKQTVLFLLLALSLSSPIFCFGKITPTTIVNEEITKVVYKNGVLSIEGLTGIGTITVYSIIGNKIIEFRQLPLENFKRSITLDSKTMFILRIETPSEIKTYKLVTR